MQQFCVLSAQVRAIFSAENAYPTRRVPINEAKIADLKKSMSIFLRSSCLSMTISCTGPQLLEMGTNLTNAIRICDAVTL
jgi:hypothetical protein